MANSKKGKILIFLLLFVFFNIQTLAVQRNQNTIESNKFIAKLNNALQRDDIYQIFKRFQKIDNPERLVLAADWIRNKTITNTDSRLSYLYTTTLLRLSALKFKTCSNNTCSDVTKENKKTLEETAVFMFLKARLFLTIDGARCEDKTIAYFTILHEMESAIVEDVNKIWKSYSKKHKQKVINSALKVEEIQKNRNPQIWICRRGLKTMQEYLQKDPECKNCSKSSSDSLNKPQTIIMPTEQIMPKLISKKKWLIMREKIRTSVAGSLMK